MTLTDRLLGLATAEMADRMALGMQLLVARHGELVLDEVLGRCTQDDTPITHDTTFFLASASKAMTITVVLQALERGLISLDDPIARHVEEFGRHGKGGITIAHALTHRGGFPDLAMTSVLPAVSGDWDAAVTAVCDLRPEHAPGEHVVYHGLTAPLVLAEVVRRADGRPFPTICAEDVLTPLGMTHTTWGDPAGPGANVLVGRNAALDGDVEIWRSPAALAAVLPGANLHSTARDVAALYLSLSGHGPAVLDPATVAQATTLHAPFAPGLSMGFGLGFMVGSQPGLGLSRGDRCSTRTFGHPGMTFTQAICDPEADVVIVLLANVASTQADSDHRFAVLCDTILEPEGARERP